MKSDPVQHQHPPGTRFPLSASGLAKALGRHRNTVMGWVPKGCPIVRPADREKGVQAVFDLAQVVEWLLAQERERAQKPLRKRIEYLERALAQADDDEAPISREEGLRRRVAAQARLLEFDVAQRDRQLIAVESVRPFLAAIFSATRAHFLSLVPKLTARLADHVAPAPTPRESIAKVGEIVRTEVYEAMTTIAEADPNELVERALDEQEES